ncbi:MAG: hypothetical protein J5663_11870 [Bacteroidaceae bacterium]|nr:hypothetical protein [Bacteroidaceae bacterium]
MRKSIFMAAALMIAVAANATTTTKKAKAPKTVSYAVAETSYDNDGNVSATSVDAYKVAEIDVPARVRFIEGNSYGINVISLGDKADKSIRYKVQNGVLRVYSTAEYVENGSVIINLVVPSLPELKTAATLSTVNVR